MKEHPQASILRAIADGRTIQAITATKEHPQADILRAIADGKTIQVRAAFDPEDSWDDSTMPLKFIGVDGYCLRIKSETININGHEVPAPVRRPLGNLGDSYFVPDLKFDPPVQMYGWVGGSYDLQMLERGLIHLTKEAAIAHADALLSFTRNVK